MKKLSLILVAMFSIIIFSSCSNNEKTITSSQKEVSSAEVLSKLLLSSNKVTSSTAPVSSSIEVSSEITVSSSVEVSSKAPVSSVVPPVVKEYPVLNEPVVAKTNMLIVGNSAFEYYNYVESTAVKYGNAINKASTALNGISKVYNIVIPNACGVMPTDEIASKYHLENQKNAIEKIYAKVDSSVNKVRIFDTMKAHKDDYIYFRSDHHWTQCGAYYAYSDCMKAMGKVNAPLSSFTENHYGDFLGLMYALSKNPTIKQYPDEFISYSSKKPINLVNYDKNGNAFKGTAVADVSGFGVSSKYLGFINGDNSLGVLTNDAITDNSSCIIVKDSYGNAFAPFLAQNYHTIYVVDFRYYTKGIVNLAKEKGVSDIIFINAISTTRSSDLVNKLNNAI